MTRPGNPQTKHRLAHGLLVLDPTPARSPGDRIAEIDLPLFRVRRQLQGVLPLLAVHLPASSPRDACAALQVSRARAEWSAARPPATTNARTSLPALSAHDGIHDAWRPCAWATPCSAATRRQPRHARQPVAAGRVARLIAPARPSEETRMKIVAPSGNLDEIAALARAGRTNSTGHAARVAERFGVWRQRTNPSWRQPPRWPARRGGGVRPPQWRTALLVLNAQQYSVE